MDPVQTIAKNIRALREERKLSLEALSGLSGVSKSMLAQIERGDVNPTIGTLWKISDGLKLSFTRLLEKPEAPVELVDTAAMSPLLADSGKYRNYPLFLFDEDRRFEIYSIEMDPGARNDAGPHPPGTEEYVVVYEGKAAIAAEGGDFIVNTGCAAKFPADKRHVYTNIGPGVCRLCMVIHYPK